MAAASRRTSRTAANRPAARRGRASIKPQTGPPAMSTPPWKGLRTDRMPLFIGYDQAERMMAVLLDRVVAWQPDAVAGIVRGGLVPATMVSCMLGLALHMLAWDRASDVTRWVGPRPDGKRVLLVD